MQHCVWRSGTLRKIALLIGHSITHRLNLDDLHRLVWCQYVMANCPIWETWTKSNIQWYSNPNLFDNQRTLPTTAETTIGFVESVIQLCGLDWSVSDLCTLNRRHKQIDINIPYQANQKRLRLLVESTSIKILIKRTYIAERKKLSKNLLLILYILK